MAVKTDAIGKEWPGHEYEVGREKIREYARVVGPENPVHLDREAAKAAGFRDVVAPPMFCVVYSAPALAPAMLDPEVGMNLAAMVHGGQEFEWGEPVCSGDEITTTRQVQGDLREGRQGLLRLRDESRSTRTATQVVQRHLDQHREGGVRWLS